MNSTLRITMREYMEILNCDHFSASPITDNNNDTPASQCERPPLTQQSRVSFAEGTSFHQRTDGMSHHLCVGVCGVRAHVRRGPTSSLTLG